MANNDNKLTVFQRLNRVLGTDSTIPVDYTRVNPGLPISSDNADRILYQTTDKADYERKKLELRQNKFLAIYKHRIDTTSLPRVPLGAVDTMYFRLHKDEVRYFPPPDTLTPVLDTMVFRLDTLALALADSLAVLIDSLEVQKDSL